MGAPPRRRRKPEPPLTAAELADLLAEGRIRTRYQPIVRLDDRRPVALEVLARLEHPVRGTMPPDQFVPQVEDAGLAGLLTRAVAARAFAEWGGALLPDLGWTLAFNVPLDVLLDPGTLPWLEQARDAAGIPVRHLAVELTESRELTQLPELRAAAAALRHAGYGLAIDDVGPDVRDHRALLDMGFTSMKLDRDVVRESVDSESAHAFVVAAIAEARAARLAIVAEGVEDADIWAHMRELGVDWAQGFLVARPLPAAAVAGWRRDWQARSGPAGGG